MLRSLTISILLQVSLGLLFLEYIASGSDDSFRPPQCLFGSNGYVSANFIQEVNFQNKPILFFVFDVSGSVGQRNFDQSIEFAKDMVRKVGISEHGGRAGALIFSSRPEIHFLPMQFIHTEDVLRALDEIQYTGGGSAPKLALKMIREDILPLNKAINHHNEGFIIFFLSDGKWNMNGTPLYEAERLKAEGVLIYCIGITGDVRLKPLHKIASISSERRNVFVLQNYEVLSFLIQEITNGTVDYSQCGLRAETFRSRPRRVVGGNIVSAPWPWMAALYYDKNSALKPELKCGGTLIQENFILTCAHCMYKPNGEFHDGIIVKLGLTDLRNESHVQESAVMNIHIHPNYHPGSSYDYDIALLQLERRAEYNNFVSPICLPPKELPEKSSFYSPNELGWAIGWGYEGMRHPSVQGKWKITQNLKEISLPIQSTERCIQSLLDKVNRSYFTDRMFCAGDEKGESDTCMGDAGGPLMQSQINSDGYRYWTQVGIISWGLGCAVENNYGFYTHVQNLMPWIDDTIEAALKEMK